MYIQNIRFLRYEFQVNIHINELIFLNSYDLFQGKVFTYYNGYLLIVITSICQYVVPQHCQKYQENRADVHLVNYSTAILSKKFSSCFKVQKGIKAMANNCTNVTKCHMQVQMVAF